MGKKARKTQALEITGDPEMYMIGLSPQAKALANATLIVQNSQHLPVHIYVLAANSPMFAELFESAQPVSSRSSRFNEDTQSDHPRAARVKVPLDDDLATVCTALKYSYVAGYITSPSRPVLETDQDAFSLARFAHKYAMQGLLAEDTLSNGHFRLKARRSFTTQRQ